VRATRARFDAYDNVGGGRYNGSMHARGSIVIAILSMLVALTSTGAAPTSQPALPERTSKYNVGGAPGRQRGADGKIRRFELKSPAPLFDGGGREIGRVEKPVLLNIGAGKRMDLDGKAGDEAYLWAWKTDAGSGWIARDAIVDAPEFEIDTSRNPKPPGEANGTPLVIDAAKGTAQLTGLRHTNSQGVIPTEGGNKGEHYAGRNPGPKDYVYLLFACPNVQRGGVARDSIPDGGRFIQALDEHGKPIVETMTMYQAGDFTKPVSVTFLYGRAEHGDTYGWLARANVGQR
jgi:hypothetical protein